MNRMRMNADSQWRTSQQLTNKPLLKSPMDDKYALNPYTKGQNDNIINRNSQNLKGKPLISPKRTHPHHTDKNQNALSHRTMQSHPTQAFLKPPLSERFQNTGRCLNHPTKKAEFLVQTDGQQLYCGRCAAQLATRGCEVIRLQQSVGVGASRRELPDYPEYQNEPIYQQILEILRLCNGVIGEHNSNIQRFGALEDQYNRQMETTSAFYDRMLEIIQEMKADHLYDLALERDKYTQIADIENDHLRENIIEINGIKNDIENHLEEVLEGIRQSGNEAECKESLQHYRQKLTLFNHQIEQQIDSLKDITRYPQAKIDNMLQEFQNFLNVLWDTPTDPPKEEQQLPRAAKNISSALTVKNIHQILPRGVNNDKQGKRAFRNLEEDQDHHFQERKSPNFKKI